MLISLVLVVCNVFHINVIVVGPNIFTCGIYLTQSILFSYLFFDYYQSMFQSRNLSPNMLQNALGSKYPSYATEMNTNKFFRTYNKQRLNFSIHEHNILNNTVCLLLSLVNSCPWLHV